MGFLKKIDIKSLLIIILLIMFTVSMLTRPASVNVKYYEEEIKKLNIVNEKILLKNDSISLENLKLDETLENINSKIDSIDKELASKDYKIKELKRKKDEIPKNVFNMGADDVTRSLTEYLKRRN
jgi:predicted RNase H-like nuclease (RuvC/YqgF family)